MGEGFVDAGEAVVDAAGAAFEVISWPFERLADAALALTGVDVRRVAASFVDAAVATVRRIATSPDVWLMVVGAVVACVGPQGPIGCPAAATLLVGDLGARASQQAATEVKNRLIDEIGRAGEANMGRLNDLARATAEGVVDRAKEEVRSRVAGAVDAATAAARAEALRVLLGDPRRIAEMIDRMAGATFSSAMAARAGTVFAAHRVGLSDARIVGILREALTVNARAVIEAGLRSGSLDWSRPSREGLRAVREAAIAAAADALPRNLDWARLWQVLALAAGGPWNVRTQAEAAIEGLERPHLPFASEDRGSPALIGAAAIWASNLQNTARTFVAALSKTHAFDAVRQRIARRYGIDDGAAADRIRDAFLLLGDDNLRAGGIPRDWPGRAAWAQGEAARIAGDPARNAAQVAGASRTRAAAAAGRTAATGARSAVAKAQEASQIAAAAVGVSLAQVQSAYVAKRQADDHNRKLLMWGGGAAAAAATVATVAVIRRKAAR